MSALKICLVIPAALGVQGCLAAAALLDDCPGAQVEGSRQDVTTHLGFGPGFRLVDDCASADLGLVADAARPIPRYEDDDPAAPADRVVAYSRFADDLRGRLSDVGSVWAVGWGLACHDAGVAIYAWDWRDVDRVIDTAGLYLGERSLGEEIGIIVRPDPGAHAGHLQ